MSWFARSIADTLNLNDHDDKVNAVDPTNPDPSSSSPRGVKEDLSEITKSLSRQFWGVASFLAPPPPPDASASASASDPDSTGRVDSGRVDSGEDVGILGIRSDLSEIGGRFRSGLTKLSGNIKVSEMAKMATEFLSKAVEEMNEEAAKGVIGVSEEVVAFAKDVASHPETWLDFPLPEDDDDEEGFDMSDAQQEHALAVERLAPSLAALRMELCPEYISESFFWKIYFVLLHPKLDKEVAVLLSTPQVMEARALLTTELQNRSKGKQENNLSTTSVDQINDSSSLQHEVSLSVPSAAPENTTQNLEVAKSGASTESPDHDMEKHTSSIDIQVVEKSASASTAADSQTDKHPIAPSEIQIVDKSVIEVEHNDRNKDQNAQSGPSNAWESRDDEDDDGDDWLKEETSELGSGATESTIPIDNDEDVSFSDLEEDDDDAPSTLKKVNYTSDKDSREWVQL